MYVDDCYGEDSSRCPACGQRLGPDDSHSNEGVVDYVAGSPGDVPGVQVVAQGFCAQGDAGRMGGHAEWLLIAEPGARFRVARGGRTYGSPNVVEVRVALDGSVQALTPARWRTLDALASREPDGTRL